MGKVKYFRAIGQALATELRADPNVIVMGEDIGMPGGVFGQTAGLRDEFGAERVIDTPAGEVGFMGAAVGAALSGLRPVVEISFADFFPVCMDQIVNQMAKIRYMSGGQSNLPIAILAFGGGGLNAGPQHSGNYEGWLGALPGIKFACPAVPEDVIAIVRAAILDDDPVIVQLHKGLLQQSSEIEGEPEPGKLGEAVVRREGEDITLVTWSAGVRICEKAAATLSEDDGISAEVIDLRWIQPHDVDAVLDSVVKTGRLLVVHEAVEFAGIGAEIVSRVAADAFDYLDAPPSRLGATFTPVPFSPPLESFVLPQVDDVLAAVRRLVVR